MKREKEVVVKGSKFSKIRRRRRMRRREVIFWEMCFVGVALRLEIFEVVLLF